MRVAVMGATGYGGAETLRLLGAREDVEIIWVGSESQSGSRLGDILPQFRLSKIGKMVLASSSDVDGLPNLDVAFLAMPHGEAQKLAPRLLGKGIRVIDLSGDFRLPKSVYEAWYKKTAVDTDGIQAVYGLPEVYRAEISGAQIIANPGCYATCATLALLPIAEEGIGHLGHLLVDAKSGVSGAGRSPQRGTHFVDVEENLRAYKLGEHQHTPEIEQVLADARRRRSIRNVADVHEAFTVENEIRVLLTTQLLPIKRGIYVTAYVSLNQAMDTSELLKIYNERYANEPFVAVLAAGQIPEIRYVTGTNACHIGVHVDERTQTALIMAAIDNLGKGAAGQAVQNFNLMFGVEETRGLGETSWF